MTSGIAHEQNLEKHIEKQMGCMAGFLQIFDRHHLLTGKRLYTAKRLPPPSPIDSQPETEKTIGSPAMSDAPEKLQQGKSVTSLSPDRRREHRPVTELRSPAVDVASLAKNAAKLPLPVLELKEGTRSPWKFGKEAPRLSLDSRATFDAKGSLHPREIRTNAAILSANRCANSGEAVAEGDDQQRRSPSVIARLMGLEPLPQGSPEPTKNAELRRSASESRVSRDLFHSRFIDGSSFQVKQSKLSSNAARENLGIEIGISSSNVRVADRMEYFSSNLLPEPLKSSNEVVGAAPWRSHQQRKSFFDSEEPFPEPKQTVSVYGEIEKRLKMRGMDEPSKDLETLKQILEALQLKGLLHTKKPSEQTSRRNFVYDRSFSSEASPIVVMKPSRSPISSIDRRIGYESPHSSAGSRDRVRRNLNLSGEYFPTVSPRRERPNNDQNVRTQARAKNSRSPSRSESNARNSSSLIKPKPLIVETQRKRNEPTEHRRISPVQSPKLSSKRFGSDHNTINRSPRNRGPTAEIYPNVGATEDESSSISESSVSTSTQTDTTERLKVEDYKEGKSLLERCDKLLHSIAEMTSTDLQPSPVSVLDSSFYKDESLTPSPIMKRSIDFKDDIEAEDEIWSSEIYSLQQNSDDQSSDSDFVYISEILRASSCLPEDSDIFLLLEKQQYLKGKDTSKVATLQRRLIFDTTTEIIDKHRQLPLWKAHSVSKPTFGLPSLHQIWSEFQRIHERVTAENLLEITNAVLRKDLSGDSVNGWGDFPVETSEAVFYMERLIFKDLVGEIMQDFTVLDRKSLVSVSRRKLVF